MRALSRDISRQSVKITFRKKKTTFATYFDGPRCHSLPHNLSPKVKDWLDTLADPHV